MGLKYTGSFDSIRNGNSRYIVNIYQESYTGDPINIILGATPVIHEWQEDDPLAPCVNPGALVAAPLPTVTVYVEPPFKVVVPVIYPPAPPPPHPPALVEIPPAPPPATTT